VSGSETAFARRVERGAVPPSGFDHRAHLRLAWAYLDESASLDEAIDRMGAALRRFAAAAGQPEKYHETLTAFWMARLAAARAGMRRGGRLEPVLRRDPALLDRDLPLAYYSRRRLFSPRARRLRVSPDRRSLDLMSLRFVPAVHRATHRIGLYLAATGEGGSQGESHILAHLASSGPATIAELHRGLAHKRSTLTSILDRLTARGLITREVGAADRRTFVITPTAKGRAAARRVHDHLAALERAVSGRVSADELRACLRVLGIIEEQAHQRSRKSSAPGRRRAQSASV
jgi:DNA-binding MarR family transcriptional regulator